MSVQCVLTSNIELYWKKQALIIELLNHCVVDLNVICVHLLYMCFYLVWRH